MADVIAANAPASLRGNAKGLEPSGAASASNGATAIAGLHPQLEVEVEIPTTVPPLTMEELQSVRDALKMKQRAAPPEPSFADSQHRVRHDVLCQSIHAGQCTPVVDTEAARLLASVCKNASGHLLCTSIHYCCCAL